jgi:hypothetical protein
MSNQTPSKYGSIRWLLFSIVLFGAGSMSWKMLKTPASKPETSIILTTLPAGPKVEKDADKILKAMSDYLTQMQTFSYKSKGTFEIVGEDNKKTQQTYNSEVYVKRPNKMRANAKNENRDAAVYYDGKQFTVLGKNANMYAQAAAPPTLDAALDSARERFLMDPPGSDLLYTYPYKGLMELVTEGKELKEDRVNGKSCKHLAFKSKEVDWEIWVQKDGEPLPLKYKIISKNDPGSPEFTVEFSDWKKGDGAQFADKQFAFVPPANAKKIPFMRLGDVPKQAKR